MELHDSSKQLTPVVKFIYLRRLRPARKAWKYRYVLSDAGYELGRRHPYFTQYVELRQGLAINLANNLLLIPHLVGIFGGSRKLESSARMLKRGEEPRSATYSIKIGTKLHARVSKSCFSSNEALFSGREGTSRTISVMTAAPWSASFASRLRAGMGRFLLCVLVLSSSLSVCLTSAQPAAGGGLNGTFIQLLEAHGSWTQGQWNQLFDWLRSAGINQLVVQ
jgi:hypothetical protein